MSKTFIACYVQFDISGSTVEYKEMTPAELFRQYAPDLVDNMLNQQAGVAPPAATGLAARIKEFVERAQPGDFLKTNANIIFCGGDSRQKF